MAGTNYLEMDEQPNSLALKGAPTGIDGQIYNSLGDYRRLERSPGGLFITSGPTDTIMSISVPITKNHSEVVRDLRTFLELNADVQLIHDDQYASSLRELYDMLVCTDGAAHFEKGYLKAVKRYIQGIIGTETIEGGARHKAAAYASTRGLVSTVLSEETGGITVFREGKPIIIDPYLNRGENLALARGIKYDGLGTYTGESGLATLREGRHAYRISYYVFEGVKGKKHRIPAAVVKKMLEEKCLHQPSNSTSALSFVASR